MTVTEAVADLLRFHSGRAVFVVVGGALVHRENVVTLKRAPGETTDSFLKRVTTQCRDIDEVELLNNAGNADVARVTRRA